MSKKVFELAKELDLNSLELVEKLRDKGFAIRNHMSTLSEEDLVKVMEMLRPHSQATEVKAKTTTVKKKVVKKATPEATTKAKETETAEPKTAKEETGTLVEKDVEPSEKVAAEKKADSKAGPVVRKKVTVRKKGAEGEEHEGHHGLEIPSGGLMTQEPQDSREQNEYASPVTEKPQSRGGLRVVALPTRPQKPVEESVDKSSDSSGRELSPEDEAALKKKEYYQEKVHRFTPVYIPPKEELAQAKKAGATTKPPVRENVPGGAKSNEEIVDTKALGESEDDEKSSKKRLGGLASMMSGKKPILSRSQALSQLKAESELKSYALLSGLGKPIYSTIKKKKTYAGPASMTEKTEVKESKRVIVMHKSVTAIELAQKLSVKFQEFADQALEINLLVKATDHIGPALAGDLAALYQYRVENRAFDESKALGIEKATEEVKDTNRSHLPLRAPVVTIMGHVDHGKTTLLDTIRNAKVAAGEAGGITQHIGAYSVKVKDKSITFLDTPGHAAFANMRQRGANVTDIVILVVAADDGVMPQTRESIKFCQNSNVPIIVAVNKMDKEGVNPDKIKTALTEFHITPEEWGGETQFVPISALKGQGIDDLLDAILLQAEIMDLRADQKGVAKGVVIESKVELGRGPVATVLVQEGTLAKGDAIVVGETFGRARSLSDHLGNQLKDVGPATPVQILGLEEVPNPGDVLYAVKNEREAKKIVENRIAERKELAAVPEKKKVSLEDFFSEAKEEGQTKILNLVIRSDVQGSYEAIKNSLEALSNQEVAVKVLGGGVGAISDTDVMLASQSKGYIIGFNMRPVSSARRMAEDKGVDVKTYSIIYELINDVKLALEGLLAPTYIEEFCGRAEVREVFSIPKIGTIAGSFVTDGKIQSGCKIRLLRSGKIVFDGKMSSLKRFKDDAKEVKTGLECGIGLENYNDIKVGDIFEAYNMVEKKRKLEDVVAVSGNSTKGNNRSGVEAGV